MTSAVIGTVELTGFEMMQIAASGQCLAHPCGYVIITSHR
jgi:hypothetical protein